MDLILWRHCDAEPGAPDESRRLTPLGVKQAARVAAWLAPHLPERCRIIVSPAVRAQQTAQALKRPFETAAALAPGTTAAALLAAAEWPYAAQPVLVVGHQPTLGRVASLLLAGEEAERTLRTGALWWLSSRAHDEGAAVLDIEVAP